jgi:hypothetical protein
MKTFLRRFENRSFAGVSEELAIRCVQTLEGHATGGCASAATIHFSMGDVIKRQRLE